MTVVLDIDPPTVTGQMRKVTVRNGRPQFYDPPKVKEARQTLTDYLSLYRPPEPMAGPLRLSVEWRFRKNKSHKDGEWRSTRPDTDNLEKLLKDCMTAAGFWHDDAQVAVERIEKRWAEIPGIYITIENLEVNTNV